MKVICIDKDAYPDGLDFEEGDYLRDGEVYEVINVMIIEGFIFYEVSVFKGAFFWENCFARLSEIDETESVNWELKSVTN